MYVERAASLLSLENSKLVRKRNHETGLGPDFDDETRAVICESLPFFIISALSGATKTSEAESKFERLGLNSMNI